MGKRLAARCGSLILHDRGAGLVLHDRFLLLDEELDHLLFQVGLVHVVRVHAVPEQPENDERRCRKNISGIVCATGICTK